MKQLSFFELAKRVLEEEKKALSAEEIWEIAKQKGYDHEVGSKGKTPPPVVYQALQRTKQGRADFSDYLIGSLARQIGCTETVTFDQKLRGEQGFHCL